MCQTSHNNLNVLVEYLRERTVRYIVKDMLDISRLVLRMI